MNHGPNPVALGKLRPAFGNVRYILKRPDGRITDAPRAFTISQGEDGRPVADLWGGNRDQVRLSSQA